MTTPRAQILQTAVRLFYKQGYQETGINQLIAESGVARRTFYHHFASKEDVAIEYIDAEIRRWIALLTEATESRRSPAGVVRAIFELLEQVAERTDFRGCSLLNMAAEFAKADSPVRARVKQAKEAQKAFIVEALGALSVSTATARQVDVLLEGAVVSAAAHLDAQPIGAAMNAALLLVEQDVAGRRNTTERE